MPELSPFNQWVAHHAKLFGLSKEEALTIAGWESTLDASADELHAATSAIAKDLGGTLGKTESRFVGKMSAHLEALTTAIKRLRSVRYEKGQDKPDRYEWGTCTLCLSTGWAIVPHPECVRNGEWVPLAKGGSPTGVYYTLAVTCHCGLGRWINQHRPVEKIACTLEEYHKFNPDWRDQLNRRRKATEHYVASMEELNPMPDKQKAVVRRILEAVFQKENERSGHARSF